ncbi:hypothetical protein AU255_01990 [Methyloprofundus sedimenti]|uniref:Uncharacterized protein n=1 Tax=Methyloprofundus sedimenti TaxID=1420851 RepID=A0A1V8M564_9GAMM|nr:hypothetical protein [Methyloprofundus sedimenti]OQK16701.1 hypothetical protein AU255_01990 [Methyloprofundus sedimenti]
MLDSAGVAHISYIVRRGFVDANGTVHGSGLVYQRVDNGVLSQKINVSSGSFNTRMQLNSHNQAVFARETEIFLNEDGTQRERPFPKGLQLTIPSVTAKDSWKKMILDLPAAVDYRLTNFIYENQRNRYHLAYGDQDAAFLRETYLTTNPPVTPESPLVPFPAGVGHRLWYAYSDNVTDAQGNLKTKSTWQTSIIDNSGNISENEFWTDLVLDQNGTPFAASFRYATDAQGIQQGTSNIIGKFNGHSWDLQVVAGKTTGASPHRAGMGSKLLIDDGGGFHGIWDNSPDKPIDGINKPVPGEERANGTAMYRYSPDGVSWQAAARQVILPFSIEGNCRAKIHNGKLLLMVLGDARDARVVFSEYTFPAPTDNLFEISSDKMFYGVGETIRLHARLQGSATGDFYVVVAGPYNLDNAGNLVPVASTFQNYYLTPALAWEAFSDLSTIRPVLNSFTLKTLSLDFSFPMANISEPFDKSGRYVVYSAVNAPEQALGDFLTPIYSYEIHICNQPNCSEL